MPQQANPYKVITASDKGPVVSELGFDPEKNEFYQGKETDRKRIRFTGIGKSFKDINEAKHHVQQSGRALYAKVRDGRSDLVELIPETAPLGGLERRKLDDASEKLSHMDETEISQLHGLDPNLVDRPNTPKVLGDLAQSGDLSRFQKDLEGMPFNEVAGMSTDLRYLGVDNPKIHKAALERLGTHLPAKDIPNIHLRGLLMRDGFESIYRKRMTAKGVFTDVQARMDKAFADKTEQEVDANIGPATAYVKKIYNPENNEQTGEPLEDKIIYGNALSLTEAYARKWRKVNALAEQETWESESEKTRFLRSFAKAKDTFAVRQQEYNPNIYGGYENSHASRYELSPQTQNSLGSVVKMLNEGLDQGAADEEMGEKIGRGLNRLLTDLRNDPEEDAENLGSKVNLFMKHPELFVKMVRSWRKIP